MHLRNAIDTINPMIKQLFVIISIGLLWPQFASSQIRHEKEKTTLALNWEYFMSRQDMVWHVLPEKNREAPFMGNGKLGLMIYKKPESNSLLFVTGHAEASNKKNEKSILGSELLPTGSFELVLSGKILRGKMTLDLWNAETTTEIWTNKGKINITSFVHADEQVIINRITTEGKEPQPEWKWQPAQKESKGAEKEYRRKLIRSKAYPEGGISIFKNPHGGETSALWYLSKKEEAHTLYITINHAYPDTLATELGKNEFRMVLRKGYKRVRHAHQNWWHDFYAASFVSLPDSRIENFYWAQMYKMGSAMREEGLTIIHGEPYIQHQIWPNKYWNFNVHSVYMPINGANHNELGTPLENAFYSTLVQNEKIQENWQKKSAQELPAGQLIWACQNLWIIYRHKMDDQLLRYKLYPLLREAVNRYFPYLKEKNDGMIHLEYDNKGNENFNLSMLRWGCQTLLSICRRLQIEDPQITRWQRILKRMTPLKLENGVLAGNSEVAGMPLHLLSIYPLYTLNVEMKGQEKLIHNSINEWVKTNENTENFPNVAAASFYCAEQHGKEALKYLNRMIDRQVSCNSMMRTESYTPGLGGAQVIQNMLIQSWNGILRIFPAIDPSWKNIAFFHLRTEGGFLVSAKKENGKTTFIEITNDMGELCTVALDFDNPTFDTSRHTRITRIADRIYNIPIKKGESVRIYPGKNKPEYEIRPVENHGSRYFGKK